MTRRIHSRWLLGVLMICGIGGSAVADTAEPAARLDATSTVTAEPAMTGLHVVGNQIQNSAGQVMFLHGANRSGTEFGCIAGSNYTLATSGQSFVKAVKSWNINVIRVPLNEDCWLGINTNTSNAAYMGAAYRQAVISYVNLLTSRSNNLAVILDLHWSAPGSIPAKGQQPMPDADHSPAFWTSVASTFAGNSAVIFDLFNEPYPDYSYGAQSSTLAWQCWLNGGTSCADPNISYTAVGMQSLVQTVRATGASNIIMIGGLQFANELSQWLAYKPVDPKNNLAAAWHVYYPANYCSNQSCWDTYVAPVMAKVPVIAGEFGSTPTTSGDCNSLAIVNILDFIESHQQGYSAWAFDAWGGDCRSQFNYALISSENGTPTNYGRTYFLHLLPLKSTYRSLLLQ